MEVNLIIIAMCTGIGSLILSGMSYSSLSFKHWTKHEKGGMIASIFLGFVSLSSIAAAIITSV